MTDLLAAARRHRLGLFVLFVGVLLGWLLWTARGLFDAILGPFIAFFRVHGKFALLMLLAISLYRMPDFMLGPMANPFYKDIGLTKEMVGEVLEKKRARQIYDSYKAQRRDPGLLEQVDFRTFEMRIFPIGPGAEQRVRLTYYQELDVDQDWLTYVYPLATSSRPGMPATCSWTCRSSSASS